MPLILRRAQDCDETATVWIIEVVGARMRLPYCRWAPFGARWFASCWLRSSCWLVDIRCSDLDPNAVIGRDETADYVALAIDNFRAICNDFVVFATAVWWREEEPHTESSNCFSLVSLLLSTAAEWESVYLLIILLSMCCRLCLYGSHLLSGLFVCLCGALRIVYSLSAVFKKIFHSVNQFSCLLISVLESPTSDDRPNSRYKLFANKNQHRIHKPFSTS